MIGIKCDTRYRYRLSVLIGILPLLCHQCSYFHYESTTIQIFQEFTIHNENMNIGGIIMVKYVLVMV